MTREANTVTLGHVRGLAITYEDVPKNGRSNRCSYLAFSVPVDELPDWQRRLDHAGVEYAPPAPSAFGDPLIVLRDPDRIQLQIYGVGTPTAGALTGS